MTQEEADEAAGFVVFRGQGTKGALEFESPYVRYQEGETLKFIVVRGN